MLAVLSGMEVSISPSLSMGRTATLPAPRHVDVVRIDPNDLPCRTRIQTWSNASSRTSWHMDRHCKQLAIHVKRSFRSCSLTHWDWDVFIGQHWTQQGLSVFPFCTDRFTSDVFVVTQMIPPFLVLPLVTQGMQLRDGISVFCQLHSIPVHPPSLRPGINAGDVTLRGEVSTDDQNVANNSSCDWLPFVAVRYTHPNGYMHTAS